MHTTIVRHYSNNFETLKCRKIPPPTTTRRKQKEEEEEEEEEENEEEGELYLSACLNYLFHWNKNLDISRLQ